MSLVATPLIQVLKELFNTGYLVREDVLGKTLGEILPNSNLGELASVKIIRFSRKSKKPIYTLQCENSSQLFLLYTGLQRIKEQLNKVIPLKFDLRIIRG